MSTPFSDPRCVFSLTSSDHVCRDWRGWPLAAPDEGGCDAWARHEATIPAALHERLEADVDLVFALADAAATAIASEQAELRRQARTKHLELLNVVARAIPYLTGPADLIRLLKRALKEAIDAETAVDEADRIGAA